MTFHEVRGALLRYDDSGPPGGLPVVLVHGHPFDRTLWAPQAGAPAAAGYRVIAPDPLDFLATRVADVR